MKLKRQKGVAAVELAIVTPFLLAIALGMIQFGWLLANYIMVSGAASSGAIFFAAQRGSTNPYTATQTQVANSASFIPSGNLTISASVNGAACASDAACAAALSNAVAGSAAGTATVTVTYNNFAPLITGSVLGLNALPASLNSAVAERVQ